MKLVRCISERELMPGQIVIGRKYWIDESTVWTDSDGDEYAQVYLDEEKEHRVGELLTSHFEIVYRYLNYGGSLEPYLNTHIGFLLKDIINWCLQNPSHLLAEKLILYIHDNKLDTKENMEKEFVVNSVPFRDFAERNRQEEYAKYMGYSMYCIDQQPDDEPTVVIITYSFDNTVMAVVCKSYKDACDYIKTDFENEKRIDTEENGWKIAEELTHYDTDSAVLTTIYNSGTGTTTWKIADTTILASESTKNANTKYSELKSRNLD